jgi:hypothetical protein
LAQRPVYSLRLEAFLQIELTVAEQSVMTLAAYLGASVYNSSVTVLRAGLGFSVNTCACSSLTGGFGSVVVCLYYSSPAACASSPTSDSRA